MSLQVRWFAAARDAAGQPSQTAEAGRPLAQTLADLIGPNPELASVVAHSTFLVDGARRQADDPTPLVDGATIDVLPPFAGG